MTIKAIIKTIAVISSIVGAAFLIGCSTNANYVKEIDVKIERVDSSSVNITRAYLQSTEKTLVLRGELRRRLPARGAILGHLHIELIGPDGGVFKVAAIGYKRTSIKSNVARFNLPIPSDLTEISLIRIIHHDARSHMSEMEKSPWRDISLTK